MKHFRLQFQAQKFQVPQKVQYLVNVRCHVLDLYRVSLSIRAFVRQQQSTSSRNSFLLQVHQLIFGLHQYRLNPHYQEERQYRKFDHLKMDCLRSMFP